MARVVVDYDIDVDRVKPPMPGGRGWAAKVVVRPKHDYVFHEFYGETSQGAYEKAKKELKKFLADPPPGFMFA